MALQIFNTLTRKKELFKPLRQDEVKIYFCGPTPYNYAHIGNLRAYLFEDFVIRTLRFLGYRVRTVMNITDIDDKTIRDSQKSGKSLREFTEFYTAAFLEDIQKLRINRADTIAPISGLIDEMALMIQWLLDRDFAYLADDGSIYYRVAKFPSYGELAHLDREGMISNVRISNDEYEKDQIADFALWKAYDPKSDGSNFWDISLVFPSEKDIPTYDGVRQIENRDDPLMPVARKRVMIRGRPGWHIECSACNYRFFGEQIDIHMGGIDNLFPHHQNEVAQTEAFTGKQFCRYWMHGGHLLVEKKKMAKSAGNFYTLRDVLKKASEYFSKKNHQKWDIQENLLYRGFRLMALQNQYRENFNFTFDRLFAAMNSIKGLDEMIKRLGRYRQSVSQEESLRSNKKGSTEFRDTLQYFMQSFIEKLEDDIDTVGAMTKVFEFQWYVNSGIDDGIFSYEDTNSLMSLLESWNTVVDIFDFSYWEASPNMIVPAAIQSLMVSRIKAKSEGNWQEADRIREELSQKWWRMIDEKNGTFRVEKIV